MAVPLTLLLNAAAERDAPTQRRSFYRLVLKGSRRRSGEQKKTVLLNPLSACFY